MMNILYMISTGIGIVVGLIILLLVTAFLIELVKAFRPKNSDKQDTKGSNHRQD